MEVTRLLGILFVTVCIHHSYGYFFNDYVYAQQWPAAFCLPAKVSRDTAESCNFAKNITTWTNHGLWPSVNESYPNYCNESWHLNVSDISTLLDEMRARWPSYNMDSTSYQFWKHEWDKHGTCAANVSMLYGPYKYFSFTLDLNVKYDLLNMFKSKNIVPRNETCYSYTDFTVATKELFNETAILGCVWDKESKQQHIAQLEICFDKTFNLSCNPNLMKRKANSRSPYSITSMPEVSACDSSQPICYFPIPHEN